MFSNSASRLAQPALLPDHDRPIGLPVFQSVMDAIDAYEGDDAIYVLYPQTIAAAAKTYLNGFPGDVLYAVKANPHPAVLKILWSAGIRHFDVASIREIELVQTVAHDATLYLMHPVKSRRTIRFAYEAGIRDMAFDTLDELNKILDETGSARDLNLHVRLSVPSEGAAMPLAGKFGTSFEEAIECLRTARPVAANLGITFHVGSQCLDTADYDRAIAYVRSVVDAAGVEIESLDCGGGYAIAYPGMTPPSPQTYFDVIGASLKRYGFQDLQILSEPGRALCAEGGSTLARVELRRGHDLYINDGSYGSLYDAAAFGWKYPVTCHSTDDRSAKTQGFRLFGPTCDADDVMTGPFELPEDIAEGDWIEVRNLGAYGQALATDFNGFQSEATVAILR